MPLYPVPNSRLGQPHPVSRFLGGTSTTPPSPSPESLVRTRALGDPIITVPPATILQGRKIPTLPQRLLGSRLLFILEDITFLAPASLERVRALGSPVLSLHPASLVRTRAQGSPLIGGGVAVAALVQTRAQGSVSVGGGASLSSIVRTREIGATSLSSGPLVEPRTLRAVQQKPMVAPQRVSRLNFGLLAGINVVIPSIERTRALGATSILVGNVEPASLVQSRSFGLHRVSPTLSPASLVQTRAQGDVTGFVFIRVAQMLKAVQAISQPPRVRVSRLLHGAFPAAGTLTPTGIDHGRALGQVAVAVAPVGIIHTRALGATSIGTAGTVRPSGLTSVGPGIPLLLGSPDRERALGSPHAAAPAPGSLVRTRVLYVPRVDSKLLLTGFQHSRTIGDPSLSVGPASQPAGLVHARALGTHTINPQIRPESLVHIRFFSGATLTGPGTSQGVYNRMLTRVGL